jgi:hypothetical protein
MSARTRVEAPRRRFTVGEYERMGAAGVLGEGDRVELLVGEIVQWPPIGPLQAALVDRLNRLFVQLGGPDVVVRVQNPARSAPTPSPSLTSSWTAAGTTVPAGPPGPRRRRVARRGRRKLSARGPGVKVPLHARAGIVEVWIVDPAERRVLVHRDPSGEGYQDTSVARSGDTVTATALPDVVLDVGDLLAGV